MKADTPVDRKSPMVGYSYITTASIQVTKPYWAGSSELLVHSTELTRFRISLADRTNSSNSFKSNA
uniref:Uncharacterized protein n=1 Tax=Magnetospirillum gryphiswaldense TaxID=55518 RepID=A4TZD9_9PROT|nr:hypothetical protein MGR_3324 [Magnetospirillum gryphiswaldense MSR-1]